MDQPSLRAGYFGKLPAFGDFIRHNAAGPEITALDQWLQEGLVGAKNRLAKEWEGVYQQAPAYRFLFCPENTEHVLAGVLQKSQDKSGRKYPFLVSIKIRRAQCQDGDLAFAPMLLAGFYENAERLLRHLNRGDNVPETLAQIDSLSLNNPPQNWAPDIKSFQRQVAIATSEEWWSALLGQFEDARKFLLFKNLREILLPWRDRAPLRLALGLRFPLGAAGPMTPLYASFWLQVSWRLLRPAGLAPNYFWTAATDERPAYLFLFFRRPAASVFASLVQPDLSNDNLCALESNGWEKLGDAIHSLPEPWRILLENRKLSLRDFLQGL